IVRSSTTIFSLHDALPIYYQELLGLAVEHMLMVGYGIGLALLVGVPLGIISAKYERLAPITISLVNILQLIPSLAMLAILMLYRSEEHTSELQSRFDIVCR